MFPSEFDILLPSYLKSGSEAYSYLEYIEQLAHPTFKLCQYITSITTRAASDIGDIGGVVNPTSPHPSSQPSPASPPQMAPLDYVQTHNIMKMFSEPHIKGTLPASHQHQWMPTRSWMRSSPSSGSSCSTSDNVHHVKTTKGLPTSLCTTTSTDFLRLRTTSSSATSTLSCSRGFPTSTSTSIYISTQQTRSTSRSHHRYFWKPTTQLLTTLKGIPTSAALSRAHLGEDRWTSDSQCPMSLRQRVLTT